MPALRGRGATRLMTSAMESFDVVIVGAGAAGLMCAMTAGGRGRRVLLLEHNAQPGAKILISGGGRCNFTKPAVGRKGGNGGKGRTENIGFLDNSPRP